MRKGQNVGHVTDKENMKRYEEYDRVVPTMSGSMYTLMHLKCKKCGSGPKHVLSFYAFTRGDNWRLITCNCPKKVVWFELKEVEAKNE